MARKEDVFSVLKVKTWFLHGLGTLMPWKESKGT